MAVSITFLGGEETGDVGRTVWRNTGTGESIEFQVNVPVILDPNAPRATAGREFIATVIAKARRNRFFHVEDTDEEPEVEEVKPRLRGRPPKAETHDEDAN